MSQRPPDRPLKEPLPVTIPAQHGWFAVFHDKMEGTWWAQPIVAWRLNNLAEADQKSDYLVGTGITVPSCDGDDACGEANEFVCYRWLPELYNTPPDKRLDSLPSWTIKPLDQEPKV